jgi:hypothetical protein
VELAAKTCALMDLTNLVPLWCPWSLYIWEHGGDLSTPIMNGRTLFLAYSLEIDLPFLSMVSSNYHVT